MSKLMLNLGAQPNTHTHTLMKLNTVESDPNYIWPKKATTHIPKNPHKAQQHACIRLTTRLGHKAPPHMLTKPPSQKLPHMAVSD